MQGTLRYTQIHSDTLRYTQVNLCSLKVHSRYTQGTLKVHSRYTQCTLNVHSDILNEGSKGLRKV